MALLISYRGNLTGMSPEKENTVTYISEALDAGLYVMVDVWAIAGGKMLALGNNEPQHPVTPELLRHDHIICKARDTPTLDMLLNYGIHCFAANSGPATLTSGGLIWTAPGHRVSTRSISTFPEHVDPDPTALRNLLCAGLCSSHILDIKNAIDQDKANSEVSVAQLTTSVSE